MKETCQWVSSRPWLRGRHMWMCCVPRRKHRHIGVSESSRASLPTRILKQVQLSWPPCHASACSKVSYWTSGLLLTRFEPGQKYLSHILTRCLLAFPEVKPLPIKSTYTAGLPSKMQSKAKGALNMAALANDQVSNKPNKHPKIPKIEKDE